MVKEVSKEWVAALYKARKIYVTLLQATAVDSDQSIIDDVEIDADTKIVFYISDDDLQERNKRLIADLFPRLSTKPISQALLEKDDAELDDNNAIDMLLKDPAFKRDDSASQSEHEEKSSSQSKREDDNDLFKAYLVAHLDPFLFCESSHCFPILDEVLVVDKNQDIIESKLLYQDFDTYINSLDGAVKQYRDQFDDQDGLRLLLQYYSSRARRKRTHPRSVVWTYFTCLKNIERFCRDNGVNTNSFIALFEAYIPGDSEDYLGQLGTMLGLPFASLGFYTISKEMLAQSIKILSLFREPNNHRDTILEFCKSLHDQRNVTLPSTDTEKEELFGSFHFLSEIENVKKHFLTRPYPASFLTSPDDVKNKGRWMQHLSLFVYLQMRNHVINNSELRTALVAANGSFKTIRPGELVPSEFIFAHGKAFGSFMGKYIMYLYRGTELQNFVQEFLAEVSQSLKKLDANKDHLLRICQVFDMHYMVYEEKLQDVIRKALSTNIPASIQPFLFAPKFEVPLLCFQDDIQEGSNALGKLTQLRQEAPELLSISEGESLLKSKVGEKQISRYYNKIKGIVDVFVQVVIDKYRQEEVILQRLEMANKIEPGFPLIELDHRYFAGDRNLVSLVQCFLFDFLVEKITESGQKIKVSSLVTIKPEELQTLTLQLQKLIIQYVQQSFMRDGFIAFTDVTPHAVAESIASRLIVALVTKLPAMSEVPEEYKTKFHFPGASEDHSLRKGQLFLKDSKEPISQQESIKRFVYVLVYNNLPNHPALGNNLLSECREWNQWLRLVQSENVDTTALGSLYTLHLATIVAPHLKLGFFEEYGGWKECIKPFSIFYKQANRLEQFAQALVKEVATWRDISKVFMHFGFLDRLIHVGDIDCILFGTMNVDDAVKRIAHDKVQADRYIPFCEDEIRKALKFLVPAEISPKMKTKVLATLSSVRGLRSRSDSLDFKAENKTDALSLYDRFRQKVKQSSIAEEVKDLVAKMSKSTGKTFDHEHSFYTMKAWVLILDFVPSDSIRFRALDKCFDLILKDLSSPSSELANSKNARAFYDNISAMVSLTSLPKQKQVYKKRQGLRNVVGGFTLKEEEIINELIGEYKTKHPLVFIEKLGAEIGKSPIGLIKLANTKLQKAFKAIEYPVSNLVHEITATERTNQKKLLSKSRTESVLKVPS